MNTLNYKVLLAKFSFLLFIRAVGIYLLMTLPALGVPVMYMMSAAFALIFGWVAAILFLFLFFLLQNAEISVGAKTILLYVSVAISVTAAFQMIEVTNAWENVWQSGGFLLFPAFAIIAGWISLAISRHRIKAFFPWRRSFEKKSY